MTRHIIPDGGSGNLADRLFAAFDEVAAVDALAARGGPVTPAAVAVEVQQRQADAAALSTPEARLGRVTAMLADVAAELTAGGGDGYEHVTAAVWHLREHHRSNTATTPSGVAA